LLSHHNGFHFLVLRFKTVSPFPSSIISETFSTPAMTSRTAMVLAFVAAANAMPQIISETYLAEANSTNATFTPAPGLTTLLTNPAEISQYWGQITPYSDNPENYFGVEYTGLPEGCQVEQAHVLQRHAQRFPTGAFDDGETDENFAAKLMDFTSAHPKERFTGPLQFMNSWQYLLGESYLTNIGAATEFAAGVSFWNRYGRILYDAQPGQINYNATARPKPVLRTTSQSR
jgi:hypothetical protein